MFRTTVVQFVSGLSDLPYSEWVIYCESGWDRTGDLFHAMEARSQLRHRPTIEGKKPTPAKSGSRQVPNSFSPPAFHADAPLYILGAKTRIPAELVTCEHICDST